MAWRSEKEKKYEKENSDNRNFNIIIACHFTGNGTISNGRTKTKSIRERNSCQNRRRSKKERME